MLAIEVFINGTGRILTVPLRALSKQTVRTILTLLAYYIFAIPAAIWFAFYNKMGLAGLWLGIACGVIV